jgi:hypothetical protein
MRPPASETENRTHSVKKIGPSQYSDFFNRIGPIATRRLRMAERRFRRKAEMPLSSPHALRTPLPAALDHRGAQQCLLHRPRRHGAMLIRQIVERYGARPDSNRHQWEHLPYEIDMLRAAYLQFNELARLDPARTAFWRNVLIESFCVHARALLDFFSNKSNDPTDALPSDFTVGFSPTFDLTKDPLKALRVKLNKQLFHLTKNRTIVGDQKFDIIRDGRVVLENIELAIRRFTACLKAEFQNFRCVTSPITFAPDALGSVRVPTVPGLTGAFSIESSMVSPPHREEG